MNPHAANLDLDLYLLDALEPEERTAVAAHLACGCEVCRAELRQARLRFAAFALGAPAAAPSPAVKRRLLAAVRLRVVPARRGWNWSAVWVPAATVFAVVCFILAGRMLGLQSRGRVLQSQLANAQLQLRQALAENSGQAAELRAASAILGAPATQMLAVKATSAAPGARAFLNPRHGVVLIASHLAPAPAAHVYEMWLLPPSGNPVPAGLFQTSPACAALHVYAQSYSALAGVAVSLEPAGGSPQPTGAIVLAAKIPAS